MIRLFLVRHAHTHWNEEKRYQGSSDLPLSDKGIQQALAVANTFREENIDLIYSSDLKRAKETAAYIKADRDIPLMIDKRLRELNFGIFEGLTLSEAQTQYPEMVTAWLEDYDKPPEGGESLSSLTARISSFLDEVIDQQSSHTIVVVGHGGGLREIYRLLLELPSEKHWAFRFDPVSRSEIHLNAGSNKVISTNCTHHLQKE